MCVFLAAVVDDGVIVDSGDGATVFGDIEIGDDVGNGEGDGDWGVGGNSVTSFSGVWNETEVFISLKK